MLTLLLPKRSQVPFDTGKTAMSDEDMKTVLTAAAADIRKKQAAMQAEKSEQAQKEGDAFLAANKTKEGVVTLPSGLQYKILKAGPGPSPRLPTPLSATTRARW